MPRTTWFAALAGLFLLMTSSTASAVLITDTVADWSPTRQGFGGYYYGYATAPYGTAVNPSTFALATSTDFTDWLGPYTSTCCPNGTVFPDLFQTGGHGITNPNGDPHGSEYMQQNMPDNTSAGVDREWVSTYAGPIIISGNYAAGDDCCAGNQTVRIYVNGVQKFSDQVGSGTTVGYGEGFYSFKVTLAVGEKVDWIIDPNAGFFGDATRLVGMINSDDFFVAPEPASIVLFGFGAIGIYIAARRRKVL